MRKWMRDRLRRGKKASSEAESSPKSAPLQPAYFEEGKSGPGEADGNKVSNDEPSLPENAPEAADAKASSEPTELRSTQPAGASDAPSRRRRRRGRGGRGRTAVPASKEAETSPAPEPAAAAAPEALATAPPRAPKGVVVLAIGLPGSGKSSWFKRNNITPLSSDLLRMLLFDDASEQRFQDLIFSNLRSMLKARLIARRPMNYVDATNLTPHDRHSWIKLAKDFGYEVQALYFDVPLEVCLERNQKRKRVVEEDVMRRFAGKLKAPTFEEGFSKITVVRVKQKDNVAV